MPNGNFQRCTQSFWKNFRISIRHLPQASAHCSNLPFPMVGNDESRNNWFCVMSKWSGYMPLSQSEHQVGVFKPAPFSQHVFKRFQLFLAKLWAVAKLVNTINQRLWPRQMCRWCVQTVASQNLFLCCGLVVQSDIQTPRCRPARTFENPQVQEDNFVQRDRFNLKLPNATVCFQCFHKAANTRNRAIHDCKNVVP